MADHALDAPATGERLQALHDAGVLSPGAFHRALALSHATLDSRRWRDVTSRAALVLGALLGLASAAFFVAANWARMGRWSRFGLLEAAILACAAAAWTARSALPRQMALTLAAALLGLLLAVFGQTYQTGADRYELFLVWALVATPLAVAARFTPLWLGIVALVDVSASLWCLQVRPLEGVAGYEYAGALLAVVNLLAWLAFELAGRARHRPGPPRPPRYPGRVLATAAVLAPLPAACLWLAGDRFFSRDPRWGASSAGLVAAMCVGLLALDLLGRADRYLASLLGFAACAMLTTWLCALEGARNHQVAVALVIVLEVTLAALWIRRSGRRQALEAQHVHA